MAHRTINGSNLQRILYSKKGMRKKVYKRIRQRLLEHGINEHIDEVIEALKAGTLKIADIELANDIRTLANFDEDIARLMRKINGSGSSEQASTISFE